MPRYFAAIIPPEHIKSEILSFQKEIEVSFGATHAQKATPHITVIPPFETTIESLLRLREKIVHQLPELSSEKITIQLNGFQIFDSRTLFVDVEKDELFEQFCKKLKLLFYQERIVKQKEEKHYFVPHITIANKDLKKKDFKLAWEHFKGREYKRRFELEAIHFLRLESKWEVHERVHFTQ